jgi:hypothetical protein
MKGVGLPNLWLEAPGMNYVVADFKYWTISGSAIRN